jgi:hydrogenase maturation protease
MRGSAVAFDVEDAPDVVVAGLGSEFRHDDAAGALVAAKVAAAVGQAFDVGPLSDPLDLLGLWDGAKLAVVIDAVRTGGEPGRIVRVDVSPNLAPSPLNGQHEVHGQTSTHGIGLGGVLRLAHATGRAPGRVVVVGIEGQDFSRGQGLSDPVARALPGAIDLVITLIEEFNPCA